jgi:hypothetical protein
MSLRATLNIEKSPSRGVKKKKQPARRVTCGLHMSLKIIWPVDRALLDGSHSKPKIN